MNFDSCGDEWTAKCTLTLALWGISLPTVLLLLAMAVSDVVAHRFVSWQTVVLSTGVVSAVLFAVRMTLHEALRTALLANFFKQAFMAQTFVVLGTIACHLHRCPERVRHTVYPMAGVIMLGGVATCIAALSAPGVTCFDTVWLVSGVTSAALAALCFGAVTAIVRALQAAEVSEAFRRQRTQRLRLLVVLLLVPALVEAIYTVAMGARDSHSSGVDKCFWYLRTSASYSDAFCLQFFLFQCCVGIFPLWTVWLLLRLVAGAKSRQDSGPAGPQRAQSIGLTHALSVDVSPLGAPLLGPDGGSHVDSISTADLLSDRWISTDSTASSVIGAGLAGMEEEDVSRLSE